MPSCYIVAPREGLLKKNKTGLLSINSKQAFVRWMAKGRVAICVCRLGKANFAELTNFSVDCILPFSLSLGELNGLKLLD